MKQVTIVAKAIGFTVTSHIDSESSNRSSQPGVTVVSPPVPHTRIEEAVFTTLAEAVKYAYDIMGGSPIENQAQGGEAVSQVAEARVGYDPVTDQWERIQRRTRAVDMAAHIAAHSPGIDVIGTATDLLAFIEAPVQTVEAE